MEALCKGESDLASAPGRFFASQSPHYAAAAAACGEVQCSACGTSRIRLLEF